MAYDKFLIAPMDDGLDTSLRPWQIPDNAFALLQNAYSFRGRIRKRFGSYYMGNGVNAKSAQLNSRLRIALEGGAGVGTVNAGAATGTVPGNIFKVGQMFSIGTEVFTVFNSAVGAQTMLDVDLGNVPVLPATVKTYNIANGAYNFTGVNWPNGTQIYFYPAEPVMGFANYETGTINNHPSYAYDTQFAYLFSGGAWNRSGTIAAGPLWHGNNSDFYWTANWYGTDPSIPAMFVSNFHVVNPNGASTASDDPLWSTVDGTNWLKFYPYFLPQGAAVGTKNFVQSARIILPFKDRLLLLNTIENDNSGGGNTGNNKQFPQRVRYSGPSSPFAVNAWYEPGQSDGAGNNSIGGSFSDAATDEQIVSAEFIKDRLIVYFEASTWELVFTGNQEYLFVWQKINTELGSQSTFSSVPFDKAIYTIGNVGVHSCNGANVQRIDNQIPNKIFQIRYSNNGAKRIFGIRDYYAETVYWNYTHTGTSITQVYPNKVLVYNYRNDSWAENDDAITAFGYFEQQVALTWANVFRAWETIDNTWASGLLQQQFRQVIAGNQEGYTFIVDASISRNVGAMQITNMTNASGIVTIKVIDHTLTTLDYIAIENAQGITIPNLIYPVRSIIDKDTITVGITGFAGTYTGGGTIARVSNIQIKSKQWNPYLKDGQNFAIIRIEFCVMKTSNGQIVVDFQPSSSNISGFEDSVWSSSNLSLSNNLDTFAYPIYPLEQTQERLWHPVYFNTFGNFIQLYFYMNLQQLTNPSIAFSDFQLEGLVLVLQRSGRLQ